MKCPKCGDKLMVNDVVYNSSDNELYRKRNCRACGTEIFTIEFEVEPDMDFLETWYLHHRHHKKKKQIPGQITFDI